MIPILNLTKKIIEKNGINPNTTKEEAMPNPCWTIQLQEKERKFCYN
jgi:hypothetical protein